MRGGMQMGIVKRGKWCDNRRRIVVERRWYARKNIMQSIGCRAGSGLAI